MMPSLQILPINYISDSDSYFHKLCHLPGAVWLDSGHQRFYNSRYDILTALPDEQVASTSSGCRVNTAAGATQSLSVSAMDYVESRLNTVELANAALDADLPFVGGAIGFLAYEALHENFGLDRKQSAAPSLPDIYFGIYSWALIQDHATGKAYLCFLDTCSQAFVERITDILAQAPQALAPFECEALRPDITPSAYQEAVNDIQAYIAAGDCYQVNFTQRFTGPFKGSTASAYRHLRRALPSPFSAYMTTPAGDILSLSPERFLELNNGTVKTQPIKGTAPRGQTAEEDTALAQELQQSEKNRAENVMIVDLLRNDLSKVCEPFSVQVPELFGLQSYANVHHLVSTVTGSLKSECSRFDLLAASFPGGSITGAPKKRAMEIIDQLETTPRSVYCGSVIYLSLCGRMDSNIAIRTLVQTGEEIVCWGGGGIVADSDPELEYQESLHKIGLLLKTLQES
jgi:para-aminobenzoate synthetase component 1